ncbi:DeoR/GlpR family DNA-binding transcription regulator [Candidatus Planktophila dulcis]|uniref:DeoR/GlpR family DNA-binding transcription regulator n=1 Tax=Candidatus Planktophila dulcis TaxID=1884914 RepID=UPI003CE8165C
MLTEERRMAIVDKAKIEGRVDVVSAAQEFSVAVETIRRDLEVLQRRGLMRRVHGGAIALDRFSREYSVAERRSLNYENKVKIAEIASHYIPHSGTIFLDAGTSTECLGPFLRDNKDLTVITNSLTLATQIGDSSTHIILLSGRIRPITLSAVGELALSAMENFHADIAFVGTNGVSTEIGFTTPDPDEAAMKRKMIAHSRETIMVADSSKFGKSCASRFARFEDVDRIVTDLGVDQGIIAEMEKVGVEVVLA